MFDFENPIDTACEDTAENPSVTFEEAEWEKITGDHAALENHIPRDHVDPTAIKNEGKKEAFNDFYEKRHQHRKENIAVGSVRYAMLAIGLTVIGYLVRSTTWLAVTLGAVALVFGLISAYGAGKHSEM